MKILDLEIITTVEAHELFWRELEKMMKSGKWDGNRGMPIYILHKSYRDNKNSLPHFDTFEKWYSAIRDIGAPWNYPFDNIWKRPFQYVSETERGKRVYRHLQCIWSAGEPRKKRRWSYWLAHETKSRWAKHNEPDPEKRAKAKEAREKKNLWRSEIGKDRDLRRKNCWHRNPGWFYKQVRASQHRAFVAKALKDERYEAFWAKEYESFVDRWTWD